VRGDKPIHPRAIRTHTPERGIAAVIPEPAEQKGHRKRRGTTGGRPPAFDKEDYKGRNVVARNFNTFKQWRDWPPAATSSHSPTEGAPSSAPAASG